MDTSPSASQKKVKLIISFSGGQHTICACPFEYAQKTIQAFRQFLKYKYASPEERLTMAPVFVSWYMRGAESLEEAEKVDADPSAYDKRIDWIIDMPQVCGMYIADDHVCEGADSLKDSMKEYIDLTKEWLKNELKPESWKGEE